MLSGLTRKERLLIILMLTMLVTGAVVRHLRRERGRTILPGRESAVQLEGPTKRVEGGEGFEERAHGQPMFPSEVR